jgi:hypothetical protein
MDNYYSGKSNVFKTEKDDMNSNLLHGYQTVFQNPITGEFTEVHYAIFPDGLVLESDPITSQRDKVHFFGQSKNSHASEMNPNWVKHNAEFIGNYPFSGRRIL